MEPLTFGSIYRSALLVVTVVLLIALSCRGSAVPCEPLPENFDKPIEWQPRTPEQTLYAYVRCLNDSTASIEMKIRWVRWQPDASPESQCYVKCVSEELGLYNPSTREFQPERFIRQAGEFFAKSTPELQTLREDAHRMLSGPLADTSCESVFNKYAGFYTIHTNTILRMFHGDYRDLPNTYERLGNRVKQIGQTYVDYCEKLHGENWNIENSCPSASLIDCILRGFRWIKEGGDLNVNEIRRDYASAGYDEEKDLSCWSNVTNSYDVYHCLREKSKDKLKKVINQRNQKTAFYFDLTSQDEPWLSAVEFANNLK